MEKLNTTQLFDSKATISANIVELERQIFQLQQELKSKTINLERQNEQLLTVRSEIEKRSTQN